MKNQYLKKSMCEPMFGEMILLFLRAYYI